MKWKVKELHQERLQPVWSLSTGVLLTLLVLMCQSAPSTQNEVVFFEEPRFEGDRLFLSLGTGCYTMEKDWDDRVSSIDTKGNCIMAYEQKDCRGRSLRMPQGSTDLIRFQFDNKLSSVSACSKENGGISRSETSAETRDGLDIWRVGLEEHNKYRRMHGVSPLKGDRQLHDDAQDHADYLAKNNRFEVSPGTKYGENLATSYKKDKLDAVREVIKRWYDKIEYYNFRDPESNRNRPKSGQFSSVVWKSTTHLGIGVAKNNHDNKWVVVVFYDPAATRSKYGENVLPSSKGMHTEDPTLLKTSVLGNFYRPRRKYGDVIA